MLSRQFELARVDEAREGALIQVIDKALPAEKKSRPKRLMTALGAAVGTGLLLLLWIFTGHALRNARNDPAKALQLQQFKQAWRGQLL